MRSKWIGMLLAGAVVLGAGFCASGTITTTSMTSVSPPPSRVEGRVPLTCEHIAHHEVLRPFIGGAEDEFFLGGDRSDNSDHCDLVTSVESPVEGMLSFELEVWAIDADDEPEGFGSRNLTCYGRAKCWLRGPNDCTLGKQRAGGFSDFIADGRAVPAEVQVRVSIWPDNFERDLCKADRWSKAMAQEFLNKSLRYLLTGS